MHIDGRKDGEEDGSDKGQRKVGGKRIVRRVRGHGDRGWNERAREVALTCTADDREETLSLLLSAYTVSYLLGVSGSRTRRHPLL
jgi:hypothetical protein